MMKHRVFKSKKNKDVPLNNFPKVKKEKDYPDMTFGESWASAPMSDYQDPMKKLFSY